jgi:hypothetical protein
VSSGVPELCPAQLQDRELDLAASRGGEVGDPRRRRVPREVERGDQRPGLGRLRAAVGGRGHPDRERARLGDVQVDPRDATAVPGPRGLANLAPPRLDLGQRDLVGAVGVHRHQVAVLVQDREATAEPVHLRGHGGRGALGLGARGGGLGGPGGRAGDVDVAEVGQVGFGGAGRGEQECERGPERDEPADRHHREVSNAGPRSRNGQSWRSRAGSRCPLALAASSHSLTAAPLRRLLALAIVKAAGVILRSSRARTGSETVASGRARGE